MKFLNHSAVDVSSAPLNDFNYDLLTEIIRVPFVLHDKKHNETILHILKEMVAYGDLSLREIPSDATEDPFINLEKYSGYVRDELADNGYYGEATELAEVISSMAKKEPSSLENYVQYLIDNWNLVKDFDYAHRSIWSVISASNIERSLANYH